MFAATILLYYISRFSPSPRSSSMLYAIDMAVAILEAMDESVVAQRSAEMIKTGLKHARESTSTSKRHLPETRENGLQHGANYSLLPTSDPSFSMDLIDCFFEREPYLSLEDYLSLGDWDKIAGGPP